MSAPTTKPSRNFALPATLTALALGAVLAALLLWRPSRPEVSIGVEGTRVVEIAGPRLFAAPFTPGDALAVRIASAEPIPGGYRYDLRYMAFGPGQHDIGKSLRQPDGTPAPPLGEFAVSVPALIPEKHSGELYDTPSSKIDLHTNYTLLMRLAWGLWALLLLPLAWYGHRWRRRTAPQPPAPSIIERLRTLLRQASQADLTAAQQADLEQLLLAYWSRRLNLAEGRLSEMIDQLRQHPEAGPQWNRVERWLHSRFDPAEGVAKDLLKDLEKLN
ncbi:MAG: hypothetical protein SFU86_18030 [Pirellulaceae bacterium]|nr:hypothetical protein [Pirellulaceae bacterium]